MVLREQDKHFLASLYAAVAVIFAWKGIWDGIYYLPYVAEEAVPFISLFLGASMLIFSGMFFREFDPLGGVEKAVTKTLQTVHRHPEKEKFQIKYYDKNNKKHISVNARVIKKMEGNYLVLIHPDERKEQFIPYHRITEILYKGKRYWRL